MSLKLNIYGPGGDDKGMAYVSMSMDGKNRTESLRLDVHDGRFLVAHRRHKGEPYRTLASLAVQGSQVTYQPLSYSDTPQSGTVRYIHVYLRSNKVRVSVPGVYAEVGPAFLSVSDVAFSRKAAREIDRLLAEGGEQ